MAGIDDRLLGEIEGRVVTTQRLVLRPWGVGDADDALSIYGSPAVAHWLEPEMSRVPECDAMVSTLKNWIEESTVATPPVGRWAITAPSATAAYVLGGGGIVALRVGLGRKICRWRGSCSQPCGVGAWPPKQATLAHDRWRQSTFSRR